MGKTKEYTNDEVTVVWKPDLCIHSGICVKGLDEVFQPKEKPWIKIKAASTIAIVEQVRECPSGALSHYMNNEKNETMEEQSPEIQIEVRENGPLLVHGTMKIKHKDGQEELRQRSTAFCRCGASNNKPYCDGTHNKSDFRG